MNPFLNICLLRCTLYARRTYLRTPFPAREFLARSAILRGEKIQSLSGYSINRPVIHRDCSQLFIKLNRRLIPVQYGPFEPATVSFPGKTRQLNEQRFTKSASAHFWNDK